MSSLRVDHIAVVGARTTAPLRMQCKLTVEGMLIASLFHGGYG